MQIIVGLMEPLGGRRDEGHQAEMARRGAPALDRLAEGVLPGYAVESFDMAFDTGEVPAERRIAEALEEGYRRRGYAVAPIETSGLSSFGLGVVGNGEELIVMVITKAPAPELRLASFMVATKISG